MGIASLGPPEADKYYMGGRKKGGRAKGKESRPSGQQEVGIRVEEQGIRAPVRNPPYGR